MTEEQRKAKVAAYNKEYFSRPEVKQRLKAFRHSIKGKAQWRTFNARYLAKPGVAAHMQAYWRSPARREKRKQINWRANQKPKARYRMYRTNATKKGVLFELTFDQFMTFWQKPCGYCGRDITTIGLDRKDNAIGYHVANIQPCCVYCNRMKMAFETRTKDSRMCEQNFIAQCKRIATFTAQNSSGFIAQGNT